MRILDGMERTSTPQTNSADKQRRASAHEQTCGACRHYEPKHKGCDCGFCMVNEEIFTACFAHCFRSSWQRNGQAYICPHCGARNVAHPIAFRHEDWDACEQYESLDKGGQK